MATELSSMCDSLVVALEKKKESHALWGMHAYTLMTMTNKARNKELCSDQQSLYLVWSNKVVERKPRREQHRSSKFSCEQDHG